MSWGTIHMHLKGFLPVFASPEMCSQFLPSPLVWSPFSVFSPFFWNFLLFFFFFRLSSGRFSWVHLNTEIGFSLTWHSLTFFRALCFSCYETPDWSPCQVWEVCLRPSFPGHKWSRRGTLSISSYFPSTFYVPGTGTGIGKRIVKKQNPRPHGS